LFTIMKTMKSIILTATLLALAMNSCNKSDDPAGPGDSTAPTILQLGTWKVALFNDSGNDETSNFLGYNFTFASNGTVNAVKNTSSINGVWDTKVDNNQNKFILDFGTTNPFNELNEDWAILELTPVKIRLQHVSGGNGGTDLLTFEKN
jgi:hypothetical protein